MLKPNQHCINKAKGWFIEFENQDNLDFAWTSSVYIKEDDLEIAEYRVVLGMTYGMDYGVTLNDDFATLEILDEQGNHVEDVTLNLADNRKFPSLKLAFIAQINEHLIEKATAEYHRTLAQEKANGAYEEIAELHAKAKAFDVIIELNGYVKDDEK